MYPVMTSKDVVGLKGTSFTNKCAYLEYLMFAKKSTLHNVYHFFYMSIVAIGYNHITINK